MIHHMDNINKFTLCIWKWFVVLVVECVALYVSESYLLIVRLQSLCVYSEFAFCWLLKDLINRQTSCGCVCFFKLCQFLLYIFLESVIRWCKFRMISFLLGWPFIVIWCLSLSLIIFFLYRLMMSKFTNTIPAFFDLVLAWYIIFILLFLRTVVLK